MKPKAKYKWRQKYNNFIAFILAGMYGNMYSSYVKRDFFRRNKRAYRLSRPKKTRRIQ